MDVLRMQKRTLVRAFLMVTLWCRGQYVVKAVDTLVTSAIALQDDYLLQELVEDFSLSGELLAV